MRLFGIGFAPADPDLTADSVIAGFATAPGLYLHVPFCSRICPFCPYNKVPFRPDRVDAYWTALRWEAERYLAEAPWAFTSLYVGGGTPTLCLTRLGTLLADLPVAGERGVEVLPSHLTAHNVDRMQAMGFDSVSLGVQSFDDGMLRYLQRPTTARTNRRAVRTAVGRFRCVDVDLIFDVGFAAPAVLLGDLRTCFELGVDQVSTYPLMRFGYTPFGKAAHDVHAEHELLARATELAREHGYERQSVWTFGRPAGPRYTSITRPYYLGLGAGAASYSGSTFLVNHFGLAQYEAAVTDGRLPVAVVAHLPSPAAAAYRAFWQAYTGRLPRRPADPLLAATPVRALERGLEAAGMLTGRDGDLVLTPRGYDVYHDLERWVTYHMIEPLWADLMTEHQVPVA